jgi:hypothetical protein
MHWCVASSLLLVNSLSLTISLSPSSYPAAGREDTARRSTTPRRRRANSVAVLQNVHLPSSIFLLDPSSPRCPLPRRSAATEGESADTRNEGSSFKA